jgi:Spy/CpxP family protein refolding chaperone
MVVIKPGLYYAVSYTFNFKKEKTYMKKIITSALVLALTIGAAQAQTTPTPKEKSHKKEHKMHCLDGLNLTQDQKAKLQSLKEEQKKEMAALKSNSSATKEQRKELHEKYKSQMESILTAEQKGQLAKMKEERKASGKNGHFKRSGSDSTSFGKKEGFKHRADFQKELGLSKEQQDKITQIRAGFKSQFEALRNDNSLSKEQKKSKMQDLMKSQQEQMKTVLTKEQVEKMNSLRKERSSRNTK